ncbi:hypothetical protein [Pandoraea sp.]|uniref:hypothetical protein n=1 Tax=Pandoraea sp. TaxID=1883445 RepID=UPI00121878A2|nr:hypothetical protein [Pandoraea sp.]TAL54686.1 MAG: hypothetical protein EPN80_09305 [Pandoraea sp.]TAM18546.1 MAG: hypothetical protein EPN65_07335 [Pandoraea sp.]
MNISFAWFERKIDRTSNFRTPFYGWAVLSSKDHAMQQMRAPESIDSALVDRATGARMVVADVLSSSNEHRRNAKRCLVTLHAT